MTKQLSFIKKQKLIHGGSLTRGHAKHARPLCSKRPIHLVMKSSKAIGAKSFHRSIYKHQIETIIQSQATAFGVKIYDYANGGNHLHLTIKIMSATLFRKFIRAVTGLIARLVTKAEKGKPSKERFFDSRPFTRVVAWGRAYDHLKSYLTLNKLEALGFIKHQDRANKHRKLISVKVEPFRLRPIGLSA